MLAPLLGFFAGIFNRGPERPRGRRGVIWTWATATLTEKIAMPFYVICLLAGGIAFAAFLFVAAGVRGQTQDQLEDRARRRLEPALRRAAQHRPAIGVYFPA